MTSEPTQPAFRVGDWTAVPARRLLRDPEREITLEPRVMDLLICLARHAGEVVSGDQLVEEVWRGTIVSDSPIYQTLAKLRKALGDDSHHPRYIETIAKRGYRLIAPVSPDEAPPAGHEEASRPGAGPEIPESLAAGGADATPTGAAATIAGPIQGADTPGAAPQSLPGAAAAQNQASAGGAVSVAEGAPRVATATDAARILGHQSAPTILILVLTTLYVFLATSDTATSVATRGMDTPRELSIAVLPFADMSEDGDEAYLGDGIAEQLIHTFAATPELKVIARTSSFSFRDSGDDLVTIAKKLGVGLVLEGSIRTSGDQLRVSAQLIDGRNAFHIWSRTFEQPIGDVFDIQDAIARDVVALIVGGERAVNAAPTRYTTHDPEAWRLYLMGHHQMGLRRADSIELAIGYFDQAVDRDPTCALAYAEQSFAYFLSSDHRFGARPNDEAIDLAEAAAHQALALDERHWATWRALVAVHHARGDRAGSNAAARRAYELNPGSPEAIRSYVGVLQQEGRLDEALALQERVVELDPLSPVYLANLANVYVSRGLLVRAAEAFNRSMEVDPGWHISFTAAAYFAYFSGDFDLAARRGAHGATVEGPNARLAESAAWITANAWLALGDFGAAREWLSYALEAGKPRWWVDQVEIRIRLAEGRDDDAHELLDSWLDRIPPDGGCCRWHRMLQSDPDPWSFAAFVEGVIGHGDHAAAYYEQATRTAAAAPARHSDAIGPNPWDSRRWPLLENDLLRWGYLPTVDMARLARDSGDIGAAEALLKRGQAFLESRADGRETFPGISYAAARAHAVRGDEHRAMSMLETAVATGWARTWVLRRDPSLDGLRLRGDFVAVTNRVDRIVAEQRRRIEAAGVESQARLRP